MTRTTGYVPLRRGILEHLANMTGTEAKVYVVALCLADPFSRDGRVVESVSTIASLAGTSDDMTYRALKGLDEKGYVVYRPAANQFGRTQITVTKWQLATAKRTGADAVAPTEARAEHGRTTHGSTVGARSDHSAANCGNGPDKNLENLETSEDPGEPTSREATRLAELLATRLRERDPRSKTNPDLWARDIEKIHRLDRREWGEIEAVIGWCQADAFWQSVVRSGRKLREKFDQLVDKMQTGTTAHVTNLGTPIEELARYDDG